MNLSMEFDQEENKESQHNPPIRIHRHVDVNPVLRAFSRLNLRCGLPESVCRTFQTHFFAFLRCFLIFMLMREIQMTEVKTEASIAEKEWTTTTLFIILTYFSIVWIGQIILQCSNVNANTPAIFIVVLYMFGQILEEFFSHIIAGFTLNNNIPDSELKYDSMFIHYVRLIVLGILLILIILIVLLLCCVFCISNSSRFFNLFTRNNNNDRNNENYDDLDSRNRWNSVLRRSGSLVSRLKLIPYSELFFEEGRDCPICMAAF